jgi:glycosyltransferase involved in cell wall biosynthesis
MKKRIHICHIQLLPLMSGVQRSMLDIFKTLNRDIYEITVICKEEGELTRILSEMGIQVILVPQLVREIRPSKDLAAFFLLFKIFRKSKFDVVHTHSSKTGFIGRWAAFFAGRPIILHTVHGFPFHEFSGTMKTKFYSMLERIGAIVSTKIIFVNHEERKLAIAQKIVPAEKALTVYNGVDQSLVQSIIKSNQRKVVRQNWNVGDEEIIVGFVGRLWEQKDPETLYQIFKGCSDLSITFVIIGDGPFLHLFQKAPFKIILQGWVENPMQFYPAFDIFVQPSLWEGLPMTVIEALSFGVPVVASDIKGNRECVEHNVNGFLCEPRNPKAFIEAITSLATSDELYNRLRINAEKISAEKFDLLENFSRIRDLYNELIERK